MMHGWIIDERILGYGSPQKAMNEFPFECRFRERIPH